MNWNSAGSWQHQDRNQTTHYHFIDVLKKPIEIYVFVDPLCPECWSLEPYLKKLSIEYGRFFTIRTVLSGQLTNLHKDKFEKPRKLKDIWEKTASRTGMSCDGDLWIENPIHYPWLTSIAIKAAELQGKKAGKRFLRKLQELAFLNKQDISQEEILINCAQKVHLDIDEFREDLYSHSSKKALQCDLKITKEMDVEYIPTMVFFNESEDDAGLKISGIYPYEIYVKVLKQMLQKEPLPAKKPKLVDFLSHYDFVGTKEIAVVYDWSIEKAEKEMKKLQLKQLVEKVPVKFGYFWKYAK
ncbi:ClpXP adapter SpxH family protein [Gracilibacillus kekensis]|uniref:ClpXP adapter protein SpxH n=1 Tax=Gracilibacillus kekensis TaxID=1027249 RepID=A0A1M7IM89_9BACI|nr:ClpXP adapter SpxH family protein [Gracilibacillus kekensis]SHM41497.1 Predicted dithiol-disulfide isomerase, DsbA family [Gracilibacillus kekensis]